MTVDGGEANDDAGGVRLNVSQDAVQGNISGTVNASFNGSFETFPYTGTYVVNPDCSISVTSTNGNANFSGVVVRGGAEILAVATNPGETWTIDIKRID